MVTFPLSLRVSEILPILCSSTPLFPTPPLVSPNFPMFPWEQGDGLWATKSAGVGLTYVVLIHQRYRRTDRQTDGMQSQYRALHYSASRRKNYQYQPHLATVGYWSWWHLVNLSIKQKYFKYITTGQNNY